MKRLCLFAGYNEKGLIHKYVINYIKSLKEISDVYYLADCDISEEELNKLNEFVIQASSYRHEKYDFGSWQELIKKIGWDKLSEYDELILCNDSCFGPIFPLYPIFQEMEKQNLDFWGLAQNNLNEVKHLQSYFLVLNKNVFLSETFKTFIESIKKENNSVDVVHNYELSLTNILASENFKYSSYIDPAKINYNISPKSNANYKDNTYYWKQMINLGFPLIKIRIFTTHRYKKYLDSLYKWDEYIENNCNYDTNFIKDYLNNSGYANTGKLSYRLKRFFTLPQKDSDRGIGLKNKIRLKLYNYLKAKLEEKNLI